MLRSSRVALLAAVVPMVGPTMVHASEPCTDVGFAETGWTDLALTTATARHVLEALGYETSSFELGLGVIYESLKEGNIDAFLGYWPMAQIEFTPYYDEGAVEVLAVNLEGTKYTLAVPSYIADAGVQSFDDLAQYAEEFDSKIYGIEPGANRYLLEMVADGSHGLGDWEVVESSEQGMLAQVDRAVLRGDWIVFLAWEPHPMNRHIEMTYLAGGDDVLGPDYGSDPVRTVARAGFRDECPNVARFLTNLEFTLDFENAGMSLILDDSEAPADAALAMMRQHPEMVLGWVDGVTARDGSSAATAIEGLLSDR